MAKKTALYRMTRAYEIAVACFENACGECDLWCCDPDYDVRFGDVEEAWS